MTTEAEPKAAEVVKVCSSAPTVSARRYTVWIDAVLAGESEA